MSNATKEKLWREEAEECFKKIPMQYVGNASFSSFYENGYLTACKKREAEIEIFEQREWEKLANMDKQVEELEYENAQLWELVNGAKNIIGKMPISLVVTKGDKEKFYWLDDANKALGKEE